MDQRPSGREERHYRAVPAPASYEGVGWALARAYPAAGDTLPKDMLDLLGELDRG
ncbi:hypothetical protein [Sphingobium subterraneum]|nr:hypothetical protein [Sphingobium subterraneum]